ncbi:exonuclease domain-containing protein [Streptomyces sp. NBC_00669]|uniref:exonuclease domain-containing protein n=1 Tax=Streptomyces sp. NBC_00669 TaxID=2976011 RepID=UPI002E315BF3|nr:exonuclease domain-containing protein [Streptomyces sp. NBC_00669]
MDAYDVLVGFDLETTGVDPETARIVTASLTLDGAVPVQEPVTWVADPGVEIPDRAARLHGYTTARARAEGRPPVEVIGELVAHLALYARDGVPIVIMNAPYDLTVLDRECRRHGVTPLVDLVGDDGLCVLDPWVLDKKIDQYRRGPRKLESLCTVYGVELRDAHTSAADSAAAVSVVRRILEREPAFVAAPPAFLHEKQTDWAKVQADELAAYFARTPGKGHRADGVLRSWPVVPYTQRETAEQ